MAGSSITSANAAQAIVKLVALEGLPALMSNLIMGNLVNRHYEAVLANAGDTVNIPLPPSLIANNIAESGSVNLQNPSLGNAQVVLNQHVEASFAIPDVTNVLVGTQEGKFPLLEKYMAPAIIAVATRIEQDLLNTYPLFTANTPVGTSNTPLTEAVLDSAETALFNALVPEGLSRNLIVNGAQYGNIRQISRFTERRMVGGDGAAIINGHVGELKGFQIYRSQNVPVTSGPATHNLAFCSDALALVTRPLPRPIQGTGAIAEYVSLGNFGFRIVMSYNPNTLSQQFTVDVLYGIGVLRNQFAVQVTA
jgi:P22 coat protein - gene protein 5